MDSHQKLQIFEIVHFMTIVFCIGPERSTVIDGAHTVEPIQHGVV